MPDKNRKYPRIPWEKLPDGLKKIYTPERWSAGLDEVERRRTELEALAKRPKDWVEPKITLEEAEADRFAWLVADVMRRLGVAELTRSQYFFYWYGNRRARWDGEMESDLPSQLRDDYLWIPKFKKGVCVNLEPED